MNQNTNNRGGRRENAGRPAGSKNKATKEREEAERDLKQRILRSVDKLYYAQMTLAQGVSYLYRIEVTKKGGKRKPILVTSPYEIEEYLSGEVDPKNYYYITTRDPDGRSIDSMLDRVFGKATQALELSSKKGEPASINLDLGNKQDK